MKQAQMTARKQYPLFQSHLDLAHAYWKQLLVPGDYVIDATAGNGHDTLFLAQCVLTDNGSGFVTAIDKQSEAVFATKQLLQKHLSAEQYRHISLLQQCHSIFPEQITPQSIKLIVYNLGYLPGGNKAMTTACETTKQSLSHALTLIQPGGAISITCYPGHSEGKKEEELLIEHLSHLDKTEWNCCHHRFLNRQEAPSLLLLQRARN